MQLWFLMGHSWCLLMWGFLEFFKMGIFTSKIHPFLEKQCNLLEEKHSFRHFLQLRSTSNISSVFLYILNCVLSQKNSKIKILFCQTLRPQCSVVPLEFGLEIRIYLASLLIHVLCRLQVSCPAQAVLPVQFWISPSKNFV